MESNATYLRPGTDGMLTAPWDMRAEFAPGRLARPERKFGKLERCSLQQLAPCQLVWQEQ